MNLFYIYLRGSRTRKAGSVKVRPINQISALIGPLSRQQQWTAERASRRRRRGGEEKQTDEAQNIREYGNKSINGKCGTTSIKGVVFPKVENLDWVVPRRKRTTYGVGKGEPKWRPDSLDHYFM